MDITVSQFKEKISNKIIDINLKDFTESYNGGNKVDVKFDKSEANLIGLVVDYLTRFYITDDIKKSFLVSFAGAFRAGEVDKVSELFKNIRELNEETIKTAYKIVQYDVFARDYGNAEYIDKDINKKSISAVKTMIENAVKFFKSKKGKAITTIGGRVNNVKGDCDIIIGKTIYDIKTSIKGADKKDILQMFTYYFLLKEEYDINSICIYLPRTDTSYELKITKDIEKRIEPLEKAIKDA